MTIVEKAERIYSQVEHRADAAIHVLGILFAINASLWLLWHVTGMSVGISVLVYCAGLLAMISFSAAYNLAPHGPSRQFLRRLDHAAIFIMIAATYTPFAVNRLAAPYGDVVLALIWLSASFGVTMKVLFPRRYEWLSLGLYLAMGWMIVFVLRPLHAAMGATDFWLLVAGGPRLLRRRRVLCDRAHPLSQGDLARLRAGRGGPTFLRHRDGIRALDSATFRVWPWSRPSPTPFGMIAAVIFDCDGVLVDSEVIAHEVEIAVLAEIGLTYDSHDFITRFMGRSSKVFYQLLEADGRERLGRSIIDEIRPAIRARFRAAVETRLAEVPGALSAAKACRLPKAVASSSTERGLGVKLRKVGHWEHFAPHIYSSEHVVHAKPAPDLFLFAAKALDVPPKDCLVIEDSVNGVMAGVAAGMRVWGFGGGGHMTERLTARLTEAGAERIVANWAEAEALFAGL